MTNKASKIKLIVAISLDNIIGINNKLPWHRPGDLKRFKELTDGHSIIMGAKTWESINFKVLPNRKMFVVSRDLSKYISDIPSDVYECMNVADAISKALLFDDRDIFICGGSEVYAEGLKLADEIDVTIVPEIVNNKIGIKTKFPEVNFINWHLNEVIGHPYDNELVIFQYIRNHKNDRV